jgi:hypothetical protein
MLQSALRGDALTSTPDGFELRIGLPWIRSMPVACVRDLIVTIDQESVADLRVVLDSRQVEPHALADLPHWWFLQDRLVLAGDRFLPPGTHAVSIGFQLLVPYLRSAPSSPLVLPFSLEADLVLDGGSVPSVSRNVA